MLRVLMIDDDIELSEMIREYLSLEDFAVTAAHDGARGLESACSGDFDLVLLDVMLPALNGMEVLRRLRSSQSAGAQVPVLMLTARGQAIDRVLGLEVGADDYLPKPFDERELVARMRAILRRANTAKSATTPARADQIVLGDVVLSTGARTAKCGEVALVLTAVEFNLLVLLLRGAGHIITREAITREVFDRRLDAFDRSLDTHISRLRRKLGPHPDGAERIKTVRGFGYIYTQPGAKSGG